MTETYWNHYGDPNSPPTIYDGLPVQQDEDRDVPVSFVIGDLQDNVDLSTLSVVLIFDLQGSNETFYPVITGGVWESGYSGTITANGVGGYDVAVTTHPDFAEGSWAATVYVEDTVGEPGTAFWTWGVVFRARLISVKAVKRRELELTWDAPVRVRAEAILLQDPDVEDRYTPVDWTGRGGQASDAANPDNYTLSRPGSGDLTEAGEAAPIAATWAYELDGSWFVSGGVVYSTKVRVVTDYQMTARAAYHILVSGVIGETPNVMTDTDVDFEGFIVSHVVRGSLHLWDLVSGLHRRDDTDGTGDLAKLFTALQEVLDRLIEDIDAFFLELCDIDKLREDFLDTLLHDLGNPFEGMFVLSPIKKRRLASILVQIYREKGTCQGILNAVLFFVEVALSSCFEPWQADTWRLAGGSYPSPTGPDQDELGLDTILGGDTTEIYTFRLVSPTVLTVEQRSQINAIADYMKPANTVYRGIIEP